MANDKDRKSHLNTIRNNIIRFAAANSDLFNSFITLTYSSDVTEEQNSKYLKNFIDKVRCKYGEVYFIWCLERTKKGRIHIHLMTSLLFDKCTCRSDERKSRGHKKQENEFNKLWSYKGEILGFIDIRSIADMETSRKYALYIASYINKDLGEVEIQKEKHLWGHSRNLRKPIIETYEGITGIEGLLEMYSSDFDITYTSNYELKINDEIVSSVLYVDLFKKGDS